MVPAGLNSSALTISNVVPGAAWAVRPPDFCVSTDFDGVSGQVTPERLDRHRLDLCVGQLRQSGAYPWHVLHDGRDRREQPRRPHDRVTIDAHETTVKSQYGFQTNAADNGTLSTNVGIRGTSQQFQLGYVLKSNNSSIIALGDTVVERNDNGTNAGINPMLNPLSVLCNNQTGSTTCPTLNKVNTYLVQAPDNGSSAIHADPVCGPEPAASSPSKVCEDGATPGNDAKGNPIRGGGCNFGALSLSGRGIYGSPTDPTDVSFIGYGPQPYALEGITHAYNVPLSTGQQVPVAILTQGAASGAKGAETVSSRTYD